MNILLIGSGGREHALAWKLSNAPSCNTLICAPGNPGIEKIAECVPVPVDDLDGLVQLAAERKVDLVVVGPEAPLVDGLADKLRAKNIAVFGPSREAARLEGSKAFMKDLAAKYAIPTADYAHFTEIDAALAYLDTQKLPIVIKADGLAAGKGVIIAETKAQAEEAIRDMLSGNRFGAAGTEIVIEEFLEGEELSYFAICDGKTVAAFGSAQDHKRAYDNDKGPNTGGMGAYSPARMVTPELEARIGAEIFAPTIRGMMMEGCPFTGVLYAGLMMVGNEIKLIEFNVRFGDPECQTLMMRFEGDLAKVLKAAADGALDSVEDELTRWSDDVALCVVMAAKGYPGSYQKGSVIDLPEPHDSVEIFHAGTAKDSKGQLIAAGGRVLGVTAQGANVKAARAHAYETVMAVGWPEGFYRKDIAHRAIKK